MTGLGKTFRFSVAALILLGDYRSGALGPISLETPEGRQAMIEAAPPEEATAEADE